MSPIVSPTTSERQLAHHMGLFALPRELRVPQPCVAGNVANGRRALPKLVPLFRVQGNLPCVLVLRVLEVSVTQFPTVV